MPRRERGAGVARLVGGRPTSGGAPRERREYADLGHAASSCLLGCRAATPTRLCDMCWGSGWRESSRDQGSAWDRGALEGATTRWERVKADGEGRGAAVPAAQLWAHSRSPARLRRPKRRETPPVRFRAGDLAGDGDLVTLHAAWSPCRRARRLLYAASPRSWPRVRPGLSGRSVAQRR